MIDSKPFYELNLPLLTKVGCPWSSFFSYPISLF